MQIELFPEWLFNLYLGIMLMVIISYICFSLSVILFPSFWYDKIDKMDKQIDIDRINEVNKNEKVIKERLYD